MHHNYPATGGLGVAHGTTGYFRSSHEIVDLPIEDIDSPTGVPVLGHFMEVQPFVANIRYQTLSSYRTSWVQ